MVMEFVRAGAHHFVAAEKLRGVAAYPEATWVPSAPEALRGLIAWRGGVIPMIEPAAPNDSHTIAAVVVGSDGGDLALAADAVIGLRPHEGKLSLLDPDTVYHRVRDAIRRSTRSAE
jgi:chemotaxis signal transduction protein